MASHRSEQILFNDGGFADISQNGIAVPSRLGSEHTSTRPLANVCYPLKTIYYFLLIGIKLRFAVKDIIDVAGLETGLGNRCYRELYSSRPSSARCIDRLLDAGAILVGKTKTTQFAEGKYPYNGGISFLQCLNLTSLLFIFAHIHD